MIFWFGKVGEAEVFVAFDAAAAAGGMVNLSFKVGCFLKVTRPSQSQGGIGLDISISELNFSTNADSSELMTPPRRYLGANSV